MLHKHLATVSIVALMGLGNIAAPVSAQTNIAEWAASASTDVVMHPEYAVSIARMAYVWAYPMVNMIKPPRHLDCGA